MGHCHRLNFSKMEHWQQEMQRPREHRRCAHEEDRHTYPSQHHPNSPSHRHTHCTVLSTHKQAQSSAQPCLTCTQSLAVCPRTYSRCFQMQKLPLLIVFYLEFAEFLSILLCLPINFPGRRYSGGENKLPHLLLYTSCTLRWLLNPIHRHHALQTCRHSSCEVSGGCCQQFCKRETSDLDFVKCSKTF